MSIQHPTHAHVPTPAPWIIEGCSLVYRHWQYTGWPHFGRIIVATLDSTWPQGPERQANLELIASAVNGCFTVASQHPVAAAKSLPALVAAAEDMLAHGHDPKMPLRELENRLASALRRLRGGAA